jgi:hypothetical protein
MRSGVATAFVVGPAVVGTPGLPRTLFEGCRRLAEAAGAALLGVEFARRGDGSWEVTGASPFPDLAIGGDPLADALAEALVP